MTCTLFATGWTLAVLSLAAPLQAQSLAGVAKKAEQERAKAKEGKVYTNKDLADTPPATTAPLPSDAGPVSSSSKPTSGGETKDEEWWRSRALALRRTLADDQTKLAAAKGHYDSLPDTVKGAVGRPVIEASIKAKEEITRLTAIVANDQRAITEFEQEARRAGVLPGWLREK